MTAPEQTERATRAPAALVPLAMLFACGILWGLHFSLANIGAAGNVHPFAMLLWQGLGAFVVIGGVCLLRGRLRRVRRAHLGYYLGCGLSGIAVPSVAMFWAASYLPARVMAILVSLNVMGTYGLALIMRLERFDWLRIGGIVLGFIAALLIIGPPQSLPSPDMAVWALFALVTPASYSVNNVFVARYRPADADSLVLALGMAGSILVVAVPLVLATGRCTCRGRHGAGSTPPCSACRFSPVWLWLSCSRSSVWPGRCSSPRSPISLPPAACSGAWRCSMNAIVR
jgi:drug/metabolite transporter (DMT)-like permease